MGRVAREMVEKSGINVDELLKKLVAAAGAEFTTFYYYTILRVNAIGLEGEGMKEIIEDARIEDRNHFEALTPRIYELGGKLPDDIRTLADAAGCPDAYLPDSMGGAKRAGRERRRRRWETILHWRESPSRISLRSWSKRNAARSGPTPTSAT